MSLCLKSRGMLGHSIEAICCNDCAQENIFTVMIGHDALLNSEPCLDSISCDVDYTLWKVRGWPHSLFTTKRITLKKEPPPKDFVFLNFVQFFLYIFVEISNVVHCLSHCTPYCCSRQVPTQIA